MPTIPHTHTKTSVGVRTRYQYQPPEKCRVLYWNDDVTTFEFVINSLVEIFSYTPEDATQKAIEVDRRGQAVVGVYIKSIAEAKQTEAIRQAREQGFPLQVTLEPIA